MAIEISIKQLGNSKKNFDIFEKLPYHLSIGKQNNSYVLKEVEEKLEDWYIIYNSKNIGRGLSYYYKPKQNNEFEMYLNLPTVNSDFEILQEILYLIMETIEVEIIIDEDMVTKGNLEEYITQLKNNNINFLANLDISEYDNLQLYAAYFPIVLSKEILMKVIEKPAFLGVYLNEKQQEDIYYPSPLFLKNNTTNQIIGVFVLSTQCTSVFPLKPRVPYGLDFTDEEVLWKVNLVSNVDDNISGEFTYDEFLERSELETIEKFDDSMHYITVSETLGLEWLNKSDAKFVSDFYLETEKIDNNNPSLNDVLKAIVSMEYDEEDPSFVILDLKEKIDDILYVQAIIIEDLSYNIELRVGSETHFKHYRLNTNKQADLVEHFKTTYNKKAINYSNWTDVTAEFL